MAFSDYKTLEIVQAHLSKLMTILDYLLSGANTQL